MRLYRARDARELFFRPATEQVMRTQWRKTKTKSNKKQHKGLTDKQRAAEAHAHYVIHHGTNRDADKFLQHIRMLRVFLWLGA